MHSGYITLFLLLGIMANANAAPVGLSTSIASSTAPLAHSQAGASSSWTQKILSKIPSSLPSSLKKTPKKESPPLISSSSGKTATSFGEANKLLRDANDVLLHTEQQRDQIASRILQSTKEGRRIDSAYTTASQAEKEAFSAFITNTGSDKALAKKLQKEFLRKASAKEKASKDRKVYLNGFPDYKAAEEQVSVATLAYESAHTVRPIKT